MRQRENLYDVFETIFKRRDSILKITAAAAVLSVLIALLLPVYYKASTTFLAASPDLNNSSKLFSGDEVNVYGTGNDIERLIAVANSEEVVSHLIDSFNLYEVYDIEPNTAKGRHAVRERLSKLYNVERTRYDEIKIEVEDRSAERSAALANAARNRIGVVLQNLTKNGQHEMEQMFRSSLKAKETRMDKITDSLKILSKKYGIVDVESQSEEMSGLLGSAERTLISDSIKLVELKRLGGQNRKIRDTLTYIAARMAAAKNSKAKIQEQMNLFAEGRGSVEALRTEHEIISKQIAYDQEKIRQMETMGKSGGTVLHLLDRAYVPDKKARPVRWLIVVGCTLAAFLLSILGLLIFDSYKASEWKELFAK